uniref:Uncharacterized protein n=1 Tax=Panagrolaimus sp. PS1159 TaxID=55785 RepID=A0AC35G849_9BILA
MNYFYIFGILFIPGIFALPNLTEEIPELQSKTQNLTNFKIIEVHWGHIKPYYIIALWILVICFLRADYLKKFIM